MYNEYAFPVPELGTTAMGMTLRDYFAARALQSALTGARLPGLPEADPDTMKLVDEIALSMYRIADAMLEARLVNGKT